jgi:hypothetical protein
VSALGSGVRYGGGDVAGELEPFLLKLSGREITDAALWTANDLADMFADLVEEFDERLGDVLCRLIETGGSKLTHEQWNRIAEAAPPEHRADT